MFSASTYTSRRKQLCEALGNGKVLLLGNNDTGMNYSGNTYHFRQDSTFLYFTGIDRAGLAAVIDTQTGETTVFGNELDMDDIVWTGELPTIADAAAKAGITKTLPSKELRSALSGEIHYLPPYRHDNLIKVSDLLGKQIAAVKDDASLNLIKAIAAQRSIKTAEEIEQIDLAVRITNDLHMAAMMTARPGLREADVHAAIQAVIARQDTALSFPAIVSTAGQILHNHAHHQVMESGRLLLVDCGAEAPISRYAGDMTRTFPVDQHFTQKQKEVYQAVLDAQMASIATLKPDQPFKEAHLTSARVIAESMKAIGLMKGDVNDAVEAGASALFFPHGLGHMMGLDVHDMEDYGENHIGYGDGFERSNQFGLAFLRLAKPLKAGNVVTVEPGIYFIPQLIDKWNAEGLHKEFINYDALEAYKDFGGIRIEDDYVITDTGARLLGGNVPKKIKDVEALRGTAFD